MGCTEFEMWESLHQFIEIFLILCINVPSFRYFPMSDWHTFPLLFDLKGGHLPFNINLITLNVSIGTIFSFLQQISDVFENDRTWVLPPNIIDPYRLCKSRWHKSTLFGALPPFKICDSLRVAALSDFCSWLIHQTSICNSVKWQIDWSVIHLGFSCFHLISFYNLLMLKIFLR